MKASEIEILRGNSHQVKSDICVVIDVLRASSTQFSLFQKGASKIYLAASEEEAFGFKEKWPRFLLAGERDGLKIEGFDFGNSPLEINEFQGEIENVIHKTSNGTKALLGARPSGEVYSVGLNGLPSLVKYLESALPEIESLVVVASHKTSDEDFVVAEYLKSQLGEKSLSLNTVEERIRVAECAEKFSDSENPAFREEDLTLCAQDLDANFLMKLNTENSLCFLEKVSL